MKAKRKRVVWSQGSAPAKKEKIRPHPFVGEQLIAAHNVELFQEMLKPGMLWETTQALLPNPPNYYGQNIKQHELSYVNSTWSLAPTSIQPGTMAIYAGTVRVSEEDRAKHTLISINRHTFIIGGIRYMTTNLNLFRPVS